MLWFSPKDKIAKERFVAARAQSDCAQHHMGVWQSVQARLNLYVPFAFSTKRILRNNCWVWLFSVLPADPVPQESVYGRREGCITGLAVFHRDRANIFRTSAGIKSAVIHDVKMLPRHAMWKPTALWLKRLNAPSGGLPNMFVVYQPLFWVLECWMDYTCDLCLQASPTKQNLPHLGRAITDQQEMKQAPDPYWHFFVHQFFPKHGLSKRIKHVKT
jgi:hypothetical protein